MNEHPSSATTASSTAKLFELVYDELRRVAQSMMTRERAEHTLSATALVNEAYVRLESSSGCREWVTRGHFFSAAAEAMRRILIDRARARSTHKRKSQQVFLELDLLQDGHPLDLDFVIDLDHLLGELAQDDAQAAEFLKLRLFAGCSVVQAGEILGLTRWSAYRLWEFCLAWFAANCQRPL